MLPAGYRITAAGPEHIDRLPGVELAAASRFRGWNVPADVFEDADEVAVFEAARAAGLLWVALTPAGEAVGFVRVEPAGDRLHIAEMDVLPEHGGRGLGGGLLDEVERWAQAHGFSELTLTTYRDVPWNGPFYRRRGFEVVEPERLDRELAARRADEARRGLDSMPRVAMRKRLAVAERPSIVEVATAEELEAVRGLLGEWFAFLVDERGIDMSYQSIDDELAGLPGAFAPPRGRLWLARDAAGGEAAGCVALRPMAEDGVCELKRLYVRPAWRGRGIGRRLTKRAIDEAQGVGYRLMRLDTGTFLDASRELYASLGFVETGPYYDVPPDVRRVTVFMELPLADGRRLSGKG